MLTYRVVNIATCIALAVLLCLLFTGLKIPTYLFAVVAGVWLVLTAVGAFHIRWDYHLTGLHRLRDADKSEIALTFDDGPHPKFTPVVLDLLKKHGAKATFFCIGKQAEKHPGLLKRIAAEGHDIGIHTWSHSNWFGFFSTGKVVRELEKTRQLIKKIAGVDTRLYRPAFGVTNPQIAKAVRKLDLQVISWSIRSLDTTRLGERAVLGRITKRLGPGDTVLMHDTDKKTVSVLESLLTELKERKLQSVAVGKLFSH